MFGSDMARAGEGAVVAAFIGAEDIPRLHQWIGAQPLPATINFPILCKRS
jgi:hypothetical protein